MSLLDRLERGLERALEGVFPAAAGVTPTEIARELARALEAGKQVSITRTYAPNELRVMLNSADAAALESVRSRLEGEYVAYLSQVAAERQYTLTGPMRVRLEADDDVTPGRVRVEATFREPERAWLEFVGGADHGRRFAVVDSAVIGRDASADIHLEDDTVSRRHAEILRQGGLFVLRDLGSTNGTLLNGERVQEVELQDGDQVELGAARAHFRLE